MSTQDQALFEARISDCVRLGEKRPAFLGFLELSERAEAERYLQHIHAQNYMFFGGWNDAERVIFGVFPDYLEPDGSYFPLTALTARFRKQDTLTHRDFLGSFMAQGVVRASLGDILIEEGRAVLFVKTELAPHFLSQIEKIGRVGVHITEGFSEPLPAAHSFQPIGGVIASERLDCLVALLAASGREKAAQMISGGYVSVNHRETLSVSAKVEEGDVISIRRYGRFIVDSLGPRTKKGRLSIKCRKYI
ncbi:MAG: hypothetical protein J6I98_06100 [Clostridia bacterium]|nr:hypothetical protein [Clostridia bacterium]